VAVTVGKLIERLKEPLQLEQLAGTDGKQREIENPDVSSPGLALAGYVGRFTAERVQILGETEITYLSTLGEVERRRILAQFFAFPIPCVFITKGLEAVTPLVELAQSAGVPVHRSPLKTAGCAAWNSSCRPAAGDWWPRERVATTARRCPRHWHTWRRSCAGRAS
jgi:HPr kinase/phosphorylase